MFNADRNRAYALYVQSGQKYTLDEVSKLLAISLSSLKKWSKIENWKDERRKYWEYLKQKKDLQTRIKLRALEVAATTDDDNVRYKMMNSLIGAEKIELAKTKQSELGAISPQLDQNFYKDLADALHERLMKRFANDGDKYNALRLIEAELIEEILLCKV